MRVGVSVDIGEITKQARAFANLPRDVEAVMADAGSRSGPSGDPVIRVELAAARVSITGAASPVLVGAVLRALR